MCSRDNNVNAGSNIADRRYEYRSLKIVNIKELEELISR